MNRRQLLKFAIDKVTQFKKDLQTELKSIKPVVICREPNGRAHKKHWRIHEFGMPCRCGYCGKEFLI